MLTKKEMTAFETDASRLVGNADKVFLPEDIEKVQELVKKFSDIVPRGAGTNFVGGCIPNNSVVIDMNKLSKVLYLDKVKKTVYAEAGVSIKELNDKLNPQGFEFPIQPMNNIATIGGMVATNCTIGSVRYGEMRDWIEEIDFVNGRGELMKIGKTDMMDVCGMEGITGIIVGAKLRIISKYVKSISLFQSDELDEILTMARRLKLEKEVVSLNFLSKEISRLVNLPEKYHLVIEFDSDRGKIKGEDYEKLAGLIKNLYFSLFSEGYFNSEDPKFFFDKLKEFILYLENYQVPYFSHIGSGMINVFFKDNEQQKRKAIKELMKKIGAKLGKYGYGITRKDFIDNFGVKIIERVKLRHDPFNKMNRGKIVRIEGKAFEKKIPEKKVIAGKGEEISASKVLSALQEENADKKMQEFVKRVEMEENFLETEIEERETEEMIKDYEQTFDSELSKEKARVIEDIAKNIPEEIVEHKITFRDNLERSSEPVNGDNIRGKLSKDEENLVRGVMGNMFGNNKKEEPKEERK
ncbi:MAG: FAD-binding oxidoreductase [Candidatus Pacearchaeota archaeon]